MTYQGHVENGVVVFDEPVALADGREVRVEAADMNTADFWQSHSLDDLARNQGIARCQEAEDVIGGWPEDELNDGFEEAVVRWRDSEMERDR